MPRFFFHFEASVRITDDDGTEFPDADVAERNARRIAWELARNLQPDGLAGALIIMTDEHGTELARLPLVGATDHGL
jgi:hypothetical protein